MILVFWMLSFKPAFSLSSNSKLESAGLWLWRCFFGMKIFGKLQDTGGSADKEPACSAGDLCSIPGLGRLPWRRAWHSTPVFLPGEFPWTEEPGGLWSMGSHRVRHDWATQHTGPRRDGWKGSTAFPSTWTSRHNPISGCRPGSPSVPALVSHFCHWFLVFLNPGSEQWQRALLSESVAGISWEEAHQRAVGSGPETG